jgi:hypothetical protein
MWKTGSHSVNLFVPLQECSVEAPTKARYDSQTRAAWNKRESATLDLLPIMHLLGFHSCVAEHEPGIGTSSECRWGAEGDHDPKAGAAACKIGFHSFIPTDMGRTCGERRKQERSQVFSRHVSDAR